MGRVVTRIDQRGVEHTFLYDSAGRPAHDCVTDLGSSGIVDDAILRISTTYDDLGRVQSVASHDDPDPGEGSVVNEVRYACDGWGNLIEEWQAHSGAVDTQTTPSVQYAYEDGSTGGVAKYVRLAEVTYPAGQTIEYDYAAGVDEVMSRLSSIGDGTDTYASYKYLGAGRIVVEDYEDIEVKIDYTEDDFAALDRFGRVLDQIWNDYGEEEILDHYSYTYDRAGNRTSKGNELHAAFDEDYLYDGLDRLVSSERADDYDQTWTLDGLGNFAEFDDDGDSQTRATNAANEIESITGGWVSPSYDAAGNMISGPCSLTPESCLHFVRDAWNRQVAVYEDDGDGVFEPSTDDALLAEYEFDGANRRIEKVLSASHAHYFYNNSWQLLEERVSPIPNPQSLISISQHVFSPGYIDSPIVWRHDANGDGDYEDQGDCLRYYLSDANRNTTAVVDSASGEVVNRYVYNAYGMHTVYDAAWSNPTAPTADGILYCGYWRDAETGNYQVRNREYITCLSTFDARDPITADVNLYCYVTNNPLIYLDSNGMCSTCSNNTNNTNNGGDDYCECSCKTEVSPTRIKFKVPKLEIGENGEIVITGEEEHELIVLTSILPSIFSVWVGRISGKDCNETCKEYESVEEQPSYLFPYDKACCTWTGKTMTIPPNPVEPPTPVPQPKPKKPVPDNAPPGSFWINNILCQHVPAGMGAGYYPVPFYNNIPRMPKSPKWDLSNVTFCSLGCPGCNTSKTGVFSFQGCIDGCNACISEAGKHSYDITDYQKNIFLPAELSKCIALCNEVAHGKKK